MPRIALKGHHHFIVLNHLRLTEKSRPALRQPNVFLPILSMYYVRWTLEMRFSVNIDSMHYFCIFLRNTIFRFWIWRKLKCYEASHLIFISSHQTLFWYLNYFIHVLFISILTISTGELDKVRKVIMKIKQLITKVNIEIAQQKITFTMNPANPEAKHQWKIDKS